MYNIEFYQTKPNRFRCLNLNMKNFSCWDIKIDTDSESTPSLETSEFSSNGYHRSWVSPSSDSGIIFREWFGEGGDLEQIPSHVNWYTLASRNHSSLNFAHLPKSEFGAEQLLRSISPDQLPDDSGRFCFCDWQSNRATGCHRRNLYVLYIYIPMIYAHIRVCIYTHIYIHRHIAVY